MNAASAPEQATVSDEALHDLRELMALRDRGRQARTFAIWLASPRTRAGR